MKVRWIKYGQDEVRQVAPSGREREVLGLFAYGLSQKEIAQKLGTCPGTIAAHLHHLTAKIGISTVRQLQRYIDQHPAILEGEFVEDRLHPIGCRCRGTPLCWPPGLLIELAIRGDTPQAGPAGDPPDRQTAA